LALGIGRFYAGLLHRNQDGQGVSASVQSSLQARCWAFNQIAEEPASRKSDKKNVPFVAGISIMINHV